MPLDANRFPAAVSGFVPDFFGVPPISFAVTVSFSSSSFVVFTAVLDRLCGDLSELVSALEVLCWLTNFQSQDKVLNDDPFSQVLNESMLGLGRLPNWCSLVVANQSKLSGAVVVTMFESVSA